jgi:hypothetical protein
MCTKVSQSAQREYGKFDTDVKVNFLNNIL